MRERDVVVIDAVRTPIGRYGGALANVRPDDLAATVLKALLQRTAIDPARVDDVLMGAANQSGEDNRNVARMAALLAALPVEVPGATLNRLCGSSLQAINSAAQAIAWGDGDLVIAGGVESMTRAPFVQLKAEKPFERPPQMWDTTIGWRMINPRMKELYPPISLGETAERVAEQYGITREEQDRFAVESHQKAVRARKSCFFEAQILPIEVPQKKGDPIVIKYDESPREDTSLEALAKLKPAFKKDGTVTAGNAPGTNDGAAALIVTSERNASRLGKQPMARIVAQAVSGVEPKWVMMAPVDAVEKLLAKTGWDRDKDVDLVELNEAFSVAAIAVTRQLKLNPEKVNVNGGAVALGHPIGASGARILVTLLYELQRRNLKRGIAALCLGGGNAVALAFERS